MYFRFSFQLTTITQGAVVESSKAPHSRIVRVLQLYSSIAETLIVGTFVQLVPLGGGANGRIKDEYYWP